MKIYLMEEQAFVEYTPGYMLCIGTKKEVDEATPQQLMRMVQIAIVYSKYNCIEIFKNPVH